MITFKIHWTDNTGIEDNLIIKGKTIAGIRKTVQTEMKVRGLEIEKNNLWSEELGE